jgi:predicted nuclease of predicted toxin-antitoxin system
VRLWFDEDLSPTLVQVAHEHGLEATCNRDRGVLGHTDAQLRQLVQSQGYVLGRTTRLTPGPCMDATRFTRG